MASMFVLSMCAYSSWGLPNAAMLLASVTINYLVARRLTSLPDDRATARRTLLWLGQTYNFGMLVWFKYRFIQLLLSLASGEPLQPLQVMLPVGISFYTFQQAAFLMDSYGRDPAVALHIGGQASSPGWIRDWIRGWIRYGAFATFFPQLVIGPISYLREFQRQAASDRFGRLRQQDLSVGLALLGIGLFKKVVIADSLGRYAGPLFWNAAQGASIHATTAWAGVLAYYAQLYFDFSGYSDMALGIGRLFGLRLPINFHSPLKAVGIIDYYRRWHMTLTRVISRFLFTPLSLAGTRWAARKRLPKGYRRLLGLWIPLLINFEVIAIWHGAAATFVAFGIIHGLWYVLETEVRATDAWKRWKRRTRDSTRLLLGRAILIVPMSLSFALFRSENLGAAWHLLTQLFMPGFHAASAASGLAQGAQVSTHGAPLQAAATLAAAFAIIYLAPNSIELTRRWRPGLTTYANRPYGGLLNRHWRPSWPWTACWLVLMLSSLYFVSRQVPFIYMEF